MEVKQAETRVLAGTPYVLGYTLRAYRGEFFHGLDELFVCEISSIVSHVWCKQSIFK